jgi:two-component system nitrogen regulation response regulator GlnG
MAPAQVIEPKDLPPEVTGASSHGSSSLGHVSAAPKVQGIALAPADAGADALADAGHAADPAADRAITLPPDALGVGRGWELGLEAEALELLANDRHDVWDVLSRRFESKLILTALHNTRGRRIEAAQKLGIGRNTITRKIQELGLE